MTTPSRPVWSWLGAELSNPSTPLPWQLALGAVVEALPPMGNEPFDPWAERGMPQDLPGYLRQLWSEPFTVDRQVELTRRDWGFRPAADLPVVQPGFFGRWWTLPELRGGDGRYAPCLRTTSGPWFTAPCVEAFGTEDSFMDLWPDAVEDMAWRPVVPLRPPRIYEVSSADAWCALVNQFPTSHPPQKLTSSGQDLAHWFAGHRFWEPDWPRVAEQYDGVHLTQLAYLESAYAPLPVRDGVTTITGWGPDLTVWLHHPLAG